MNEPERNGQSPSKGAEYQRAYAKRYTQWVKEANAKWKADNPRSVKNMYLKGKYGISLDQYDEFYASACGMCEICSSSVEHIMTASKVTDKACLDHCHKTGVVRGILCSYCNRSLAFVEARLSAALAYLAKNESCQ